MSKGIYIQFFKRLIDLIASLASFLVLLPVFLLLSVILAASNNGSPFFTQVRPGRNQKPFRLIKFKTMNDKRDASGVLLPDDARLTGVGKFVRRTSLDEIPQLLNVIVGHMSLIGPRPLLMDYLSLYNVEQHRRHLVRPGITGWAQVNGRNAISWKKKFELDVWYVDNISFALDVRIVLITLKKVFMAKDISAEGMATVERFTGNN
jgi:undecaprenyl phosphate N,N'-diacetylbacillosamine 1-phosphate transferase